MGWLSVLPPPLVVAAAARVVVAAVYGMYAGSAGERYGGQAQAGRRGGQQRRAAAYGPGRNVPVRGRTGRLDVQVASACRLTSQ
jgi:hypothetical protein